MNLTRGENDGLPDTVKSFLNTFSTYPLNTQNLLSDKYSSTGQIIQKEPFVNLITRFTLPAFPQSVSVQNDEFAHGDKKETLKTDVSTLSIFSNSNFKFNQTNKIFNAEVLSLVSKINEALSRKVSATKTNSGTSGIYFFRDIRRNPIAIFKPLDEEPAQQCLSESPIKKTKTNRSTSCDSIPHKFSFDARPVPLRKFSPAVRSGLYSGELCYREVAAFLLDIEEIHSVPATGLVKIEESAMFGKQQNIKENSFKIGSLQKFVANNGVCSNINISKFAIREVQKIALLDIRILNSDRNEANILFQRTAGNIILIPIDHALSLPDKIEVYQSDLCWLDWPQANEPIDKDLVEFVRKMNPFEDYKLLKENLNIRSECLFNFLLVEIFIKKAVLRNLTLKKIAKLIYRVKEGAKSPLEKIVEKTHNVFNKFSRKIQRFVDLIEFSNKTMAKENKKALFIPQKNDKKCLKELKVQRSNANHSVQIYKTNIHLQRDFFTKDLASVDKNTEEDLKKCVFTPLVIHAQENFDNFKLNKSLTADICYSQKPEFSNSGFKIDWFQDSEKNQFPDIFNRKTQSSAMNCLQKKNFEQKSFPVDVQQAIKIRKNTMNIDEKMDIDVTSRAMSQGKYSHSGSRNEFQDSCFDSFLNSKNSGKHYSELFLDYFEKNVDELLEEIGRIANRKYTVDYLSDSFVA